MMFTALMLFTTIYFLAGSLLFVDGLRRLRRSTPKREKVSLSGFPVGAVYDRASLLEPAKNARS